MNASIVSGLGSRLGNISKFLVLLAFIALPNHVSAEIYLEVGVELGGETLGGTRDEDISAGGGFKLAVGLKQTVGGFDDVGLIFSLGFLFDEVIASNGDAEIDATVLELIYFRDIGPQRIGVGGTYHLSPGYKDDLDGFAPTKINFEDALGLVGRYSYRFDESAEIGIRYTLLDYEFDGERIDAGGLGFFFSTSF